MNFVFAYLLPVPLVIIGAVSCTDDKPKQRNAPKSSNSLECEKEENKEKKECLNPVTGDAEGEGTGEADDAGVDDGTSLNADFLADVKPFNDDEALDYLQTACIGCHDSKSGSVRSFWPLEKDTYSKKQLSTDTLASTVYYSVLMRGKDIVGGKPAAMPPKNLKGEKAAEHLRFVKWMKTEFPAVVAEGDTRFGGGVKSGDGGVGVILNFKCGEPATFREYIRRITNDVFGREPTADELKLNGGSPEDKTSLKDRALVSARIFEDDAWKTEFMSSGLKKFADKISGAKDISAVEGNITAEQAVDLKSEFYQILKKNFDAKSFKDILLSDKISVSGNTAALYGCDVPASGWEECTLKEGRGSYFTSISYLASKPSSFLRENNNYGRAALMYFVVRGDVFKPAFDNDPGAETIKALPSCLKTKDFRGVKTGTATAWFGSSAIPSSGNLCQSCHIERQMAAGSILYRGFNPSGMLYGSQATVNLDPDFAAAIKPEVVNVIDLDGPEQVVDEAFLQALLVKSTTEAACIANDPDKGDIPINNVGDMASWMIGDGSVLSGGLARHIPRAMSNLSNTSEEIIVKMNSAFTQGGGKLMPMFKAYFASETYSCKR